MLDFVEVDLDDAVDIGHVKAPFNDGHSLRRIELDGSPFVLVDPTGRRQVQLHDAAIAVLDRWLQFDADIGHIEEFAIADDTLWAVVLRLNGLWHGGQRVKAHHRRLANVLRSLDEAE